MANTTISFRRAALSFCLPVLFGANAYLPSSHVRKHHHRQPFLYGKRGRRVSRRMSYSSKTLRMSWEDLAAEWAARNRDDSEIYTRAGENPLDISITFNKSASISPNLQSSASLNMGQQDSERLFDIAADTDTLEDIWRIIDSELFEIQREASEAMVGLEKMHAEIDLVAHELRAKDESYGQQLQVIENRGNQIESDLRSKLMALSNDFETYRTSAEEQRQAFQAEASAKEAELRSQISDLQRKINEQIAELQAEQSQTNMLKTEKTALHQDLQNLRSETASNLKKWEARVLEEQDARKRESDEFQSRLQQLEEEASLQLKQALEKAQMEKRLMQEDYSTRLERVSDDLRIASSNLQDAQRIIDEKQSYIDILEPAVTNLDDWTQESWLQLNRLQDAVGLPMSPLTENGEIPGAEVLASEAQALIEHLRSRERYFEDAIFDIQSEMQQKEGEARDRLNRMQKEYDSYRREMSRTLDESRQDATSIEKEMRAKLNDLATELENQRDILEQESQKARNFMEARLKVEKELMELKQEAAYVIDELENQLEMEQNARIKESEKMRKAVEEAKKQSSQKRDSVVVGGSEKAKEIEKELSNRIYKTEKQLATSKLASNFYLSVATATAALAGLIVQALLANNSRLSVTDSSGPVNNSVPMPKSTRRSETKSENRKTGIKDKVLSGDSVQEMPKYQSPRSPSSVSTLQQKVSSSESTKETQPADDVARPKTTSDKTVDATASPQEESNQPLSDIKSSDTTYTPPKENYYYAIKEVDTGKEKNKVSAQSTPEDKGRSTAPSSFEKTSSKSSKDPKSPASREQSTQPLAVTPAPVPLKKSESSVDWDTLTMKWLKDVEKIQDARAMSRQDPRLDTDLPKSPKKDIDPLEDPLLQQAIAPPLPSSSSDSRLNSN